MLLGQPSNNSHKVLVCTAALSCPLILILISDSLHEVVFAVQVEIVNCPADSKLLFAALQLCIRK